MLPFSKRSCHKKEEDDVHLYLLNKLIEFNINAYTNFGLLLIRITSSDLTLKRPHLKPTLAQSTLIPSIHVLSKKIHVYQNRQLTLTKIFSGFPETLVISQNIGGQLQVRGRGGHSSKSLSISPGPHGLAKPSEKQGCLLLQERKGTPSTGYKRAAQPHVLRRHTPQSSR